MSKRPCYWSGCGVNVPASMLMCKRHWFMLPKALRDRIWATYVPGQEDRMDQSDEYMEALGLVRAFVASQP